jgi:hypothetical protein
MAAPQQPRSVTVVMDLGLSSDPNMHRAPLRLRKSANRSAAKGGWAKLRFLESWPPEESAILRGKGNRERMKSVCTHLHHNTEMACGSKEFDPPFPFPPGASRGGVGSPHAAPRSAPAKNAGTARAAAPPARGVSKRFAETPLAPSPHLTSPIVLLPRMCTRDGDWRERRK